MGSKERLERVAKLLERTGLPVAYESWPEGKAPKMPYIVFRQTASTNFYADGVVYFGFGQFDIELYTKTKTLTTESLVEQALSSLTWQKTETYLSSDRCYQILYEIEV